MRYTIAEADSGNIGGNKSEEFHLISDIGEDMILSCDNSECIYVSNVEKAKGILPNVSNTNSNATERKRLPREQVISQYLSNINAGDTTASFFILMKEGEQRNDNKNNNSTAIYTPAIVLHPASREANPFKIKSYFNSDDIIPIKDMNELAVEIGKATTPNTGFPKTTHSIGDTIIILEESLANNNNSDNNNRDNNSKEWLSQLKDSPTLSSSGTLDVVEGDFRMAKPGDGCPCCSKGKLVTLSLYLSVHLFFITC